jgi:hypothetical protein
MSYVNAPQTELVATHCAACGRPLVDSVSVEVGMGPDCRKRLMEDVDVPEDMRKEANRIVYEIAVIQKGIKVGTLTDKLRSLGFEKLADRIDKRVKQKPAIIVEQREDKLYVKTPYNAESVSNWRSIPGRTFARIMEDGRSVNWNIVPGNMKRQVWDLLKKYYPGQLGQGPKGRFIVEEEA